MKAGKLYIIDILAPSVNSPALNTMGNGYQSLSKVESPPGMERSNPESFMILLFSCKVEYMDMTATLLNNGKNQNTRNTSNMTNVIKGTLFINQC